MLVGLGAGRIAAALETDKLRLCGEAIRAAPQMALSLRTVAT